MRPGRPLWQGCVHIGKAMGKACLLCSSTLIIPSLSRAALNHTAGPGPGVARCILVVCSCANNYAVLQTLDDHCSDDAALRRASSWRCAALHFWQQDPH